MVEIIAEVIERTNDPTVPTSVRVVSAVALVAIVLGYFGLTTWSKHG